MKQPVNVAITGAAGQIGYQLCFRIASGDMLGPDQPVRLHLLEIPQAMDAVNGVVMELNDCAFPLLAGVSATDDPKQSVLPIVISHCLWVPAPGGRVWSVPICWKPMPPFSRFRARP